MSLAWLAALIMLAGQPQADATPKAGRALSALEAATVFCHAGRQADHGTPVLPHHVHEAAVPQASLAGVPYFALVSAAPSLPPPRAMPSAQPGVPEARAPPMRLVASAYARGPPLFV